MKNLGREIKKEVTKIEKDLNESLKGYAKVFAEYSFSIDNDRRDVEDRYRILVYPKKGKTKLVFYSDSGLVVSFYDTIKDKLREYCKEVETTKKSIDEYRKIWYDVSFNFPGLKLIKIEAPEEEGKIKNNLAEILNEKCIFSDDLAYELNFSIEKVNRIINQEDLLEENKGDLMQIADYLNINILDLY